MLSNLTLICLTSFFNWFEVVNSLGEKGNQNLEVTGVFFNQSQMLKCETFTLFV